MAGRIRVSFHIKVLIALLTLCWTLLASFVLFQYNREREFKTGLLDEQLQMHNLRVIDGIRRGEDMDSVIARAGSPVDGLRVTVIDRTGKVVSDNNDSTPYPQTNHNDRPEVIEARRRGSGCTVARRSFSDKVDYFYSARLGDDGLVVRSAVPYNHSLQALLSADRTFLWIMCLMTVAVSMAGYFVTRRISLSIGRLSDFAERARKGERLFDDKAFPDDELGCIASNIVRLYVERDMRHREAIEQERDKIRIKKQLTNNINHELKTPVASIMVCAELLADHPDLPDDKRREFVERIRASAGRLQSMLDDVSALTRMEGGATVIGREPVELAALIDEIVSESRLRTDMTITADVRPRTVSANRGLLESVFRNLINNAIAYSGGTEISITDDESGNIVVRDNGHGVDPEHLPHLFERFYRVDKGRSRACGGTGLGLTIVRNAMSIHGWTIKVSNDGGLRFDLGIGEG